MSEKVFMKKSPKKESREICDAVEERHQNVTRKRIHLILPESVVRELEEIVTDSPSTTETIRRALKWYKTSIEAVKNGEHIFFSTSAYVKSQDEAGAVKEMIP
jgi:metal-responsive CopG/Arc/MetJ family transcriptional regulator